MSLVEALAEHGRGWEPPTNRHPTYPFLNAKRHGDLVFVSGQVPFDSHWVIAGKVGDDVSLEEAVRAAELCALHCLYAAGSLVAAEDIMGVVNMTVYVNCAPGFTDTSKVANGASDFLIAVLGEAGRSARAAVMVRTGP